MFVTYDYNLLNILDVEKNVQELKAPIKLDSGITIIVNILPTQSYIYLLDSTIWIDVCPTNNNLLAAAGYDRKVKIFDRREAKIVKIIDPKHSSNIFLIFNI